MSKPTVVYATRRALEDAVEYGFEGVLEVAVEDAVRTGRHFRRLANGDRLVDVGGLAVRVRTEGRTPGGARKLLAVRIEGRRQANRGGGEP